MGNSLRVTGIVLCLAALSTEPRQAPLPTAALLRQKHYSMGHYAEPASDPLQSLFGSKTWPPALNEVSFSSVQLRLCVYERRFRFGPQERRFLWTRVRA